MLQQYSKQVSNDTVIITIGSQYQKFLITQANKEKHKGKFINIHYRHTSCQILYKKYITSVKSDNIFKKYILDEKLDKKLLNAN